MSSSAKEREQTWTAGSEHRKGKALGVREGRTHLGSSKLYRMDEAKNLMGCQNMRQSR